MKRRWDELDTLNSDMQCSCNCDCGAKKKMQQFKEHERLIQFLMGLNETYGLAWRNILMVKPLPSVNQAYSLLILVGFPADFKFTKNKRVQNPPKGNSATVVEDTGEIHSNMAEGLQFSQKLLSDQFSQLVNLLNQLQTGQGASQEVNANSASGILFTNSPSCYSISNSNISNSWIIDSGATEHMSSSGNVLHIPSFKYNLLSGPLMKSPQVFGEAKEELYLLEPSVTAPRTLSSKIAKSFSNSVSANRLLPASFSNSVSASFPFPILTKSESDVKLWHVRLGHLPFNAMRYISSISFASDSVCHCDVCPLARQCRLPFSLSHIKTKQPFELIHIDTWGPYKTPTHNGYMYFLTIVGDFSRATWTYLLSTKGSAFSVLKYFLSNVERQFNTKVKVIRSNNALELGSSTAASLFLLSQGILHQTSCVGTLQQNDIVFPSGVLKGHTPYHLLFGKAPSCSFLRSFGCLCYASTLSHNRGKFDPRTTTCVFMGYPNGQKGYKLLNLTTRNLFVSRDVHFIEHIFPFSHMSQDNPSIYPGSTFPIPLFTSDAPSQHHFTVPQDCSTPDSSPSSSSHQNTPPPISSTSPIPPSPPVPLRRSSRDNIGTLPNYLKDYVCNNIFLTDVTTSCLTSTCSPSPFAFSALTSSNQHLLKSVSSITEPTSYY
ncbi:PREDICTED: uncharacterized protein LOC109227936 [Nicotiana attenuata]|uniref:uncharacterized protein LOC109227936 n=1 Tax=Nicotiana attenuata TaxID=49451 RepID=UPI000904D06A|nr:PREDICTED: uncharacterized protein LOC109227936 [Nicotiana attenuata]